MVNDRRRSSVAVGLLGRKLDENADLTLGWIEVGDKGPVRGRVTGAGVSVIVVVPFSGPVRGLARDMETILGAFREVALLLTFALGRKCFSSSISSAGECATGRAGEGGREFGRDEGRESSKVVFGITLTLTTT